jgi:hypothetical protein
MKSKELKLDIFEGKNKLSKFFTLGQPSKSNTSSSYSLHATPIKENKNKLSLQFLKINEDSNKKSRYKDSREELSGFAKIFKPFNKNSALSPKKISHSPSIYNMFMDTLKEKLDNKKDENPYYTNPTVDNVRRDYMNFNNKLIKTSMETFYSGKINSAGKTKGRKFKDSSELDNHSDFNLTSTSPFLKRTKNKIINFSPNSKDKLSITKNTNFLSEIIYPKFENSTISNNNEQHINNNKEISLMFKRKKIFLDVPSPSQINYKNPKFSITAVTMPSLCTIKSKN